MKIGGATVVRLGLGLSLCSTPLPAGAPETFMPNLLGYWRADSVSGGATPSALLDLSGNGRNLTPTGLTITTSSTSDGWGVPRPMFHLNGAGRADAATAAPWKPMHDGTGVTAWAIFRSTGTSTEKVLIDSGVYGTASNGARIRIDDVNGRVNIEFVNGAGDGFVIDYGGGAQWHSWNGSVTIGTPHILIWDFQHTTSPHIRFWLDGRLLADLRTDVRFRTGDGQPIGTGDPGFPLRLFANANDATFPWKGDCGEIGIAAGVASEAIRAQLDTYAYLHYGVTLHPAARPVVMFDGNSLIDSFWAHNTLCETVAASLGREVLPYNRGVNGIQTHEVAARATKHVTPAYDPTAPNNVLLVWEMVNSIDHGVAKEPILAQYWAYCDARRAEGWKVIVVPPPPVALFYGTAKQAASEWLVAAVVAEWASHADAIARVDLEPHVGVWSSVGPVNDATLRYDGTHFTDLGNSYIAPYFTSAIAGLL